MIPDLPSIPAESRPRPLRKIGILVTIEQRMDRRNGEVFLGVSLYLRDNFQTMKPNGASDMRESRNVALAKLES